MKPIVAAVHGRAVGIGTTMLLHCDLVYGTPDLKLSTPFVEMGLVPEAGSTLLYPTYIGLQRASALLLLGDTLDAGAAVGAGLVNAIVSADAGQRVKFLLTICRTRMLLCKVGAFPCRIWNKQFASAPITCGSLMGVAKEKRTTIGYVRNVKSWRRHSEISAP